MDQSNVGRKTETVGIHILLTQREERVDKGKGKGKKGKGKYKGDLLHSTTSRWTATLLRLEQRKVEGLQRGSATGCTLAGFACLLSIPHLSMRRRPLTQGAQLALDKHQRSGRGNKVLYLFSGRRRRTGVASLLSRWSKTGGFEIEVEEWDISNGAEFDLLQEEKRQRILESLRRGKSEITLRC